MRKALLGCLLAFSTVPIRADFTCDSTRIFWHELPGSSAAANNCSLGFRCHEPQSTGSTAELLNPACNPQTEPCAVRLAVDFEFPGAAQTFAEDGIAVGQIFWFAGATSPPCTGALPTCGQIGVCSVPGQEIIYDFVRTYITRGNVTCANAAAGPETFSLTAWACPTISSCRKEKKVEGLVLGGPGLAAAIGCPAPPPDDCSTGTSACHDCQPAGGGCSVSVSGQLSCEFPEHGAAVRYRAGGVGGSTFPGSAAWRTTLGLYVSHAFAKRIVVDPDLNRVWLLSEGGSFREFGNPAPGSGLRLYDPALTAPSDEYRRLYYDTATAGWQLDLLDGRRDIFRSDGLWEKTTSASDAAHPTVATYAGSVLQSVSFPDGRQELFGYHPSGKLASITEVGVGGSPTRTWSYLWNGDELTLISLPDGRQRELTYDPAKNGGRPGYLTQIRLIGTDSTGRVEAAFEYAAENVVRAWRGDPSFAGPAAVDKLEFSYTSPALPTQTVVTQTVSASFSRVTTYTLARDGRSLKPKVTAVQGSCPTCGLSPTTIFTYGAAGHPLRPTAMTDAKGTRTDFLYDDFGMVLSKVEAANVPALTRTTAYTYDTNFPALVTRVEVPSTSGGTNKRRADSAYDPVAGLLTTETIDGFEGGAPLPAGFKVTSYTHNTSGEVLSVDPPGYGTGDVTTFTYDLAGRNGHVADSRTDPLVGTTLFGYDGLNRRTSTIDPNGVERTTTYDSLNRVVEARHKGATPAEDLVTSYTYNVFGDFFCAKLPRGNGTESRYDSAGRLTDIRRGTVVATPTATTCLDASLPRERTVYQLDGAGNRKEESLERWNGTTWVSESRTAYEHTCHLDKVTQGAGSATASVTEHCRDLNQNLEKVWDPNHPRASNPTPTQTFGYDALNRLTSVTQPWAGAGGGTAVTSYSYDVQDHLSGVTDAEGNTITYVHSDRDLMMQQVSPVSGTTNYLYNEHGELFSETDARGITTIRTLDELDRVTAITYPADPVLNIVYTFDDPLVPFSKGRLARITRNVTAIHYQYDRFGRALQDGELTMAHDANGNIISLVYPGGVEAVSSYDLADRPASLLARRAGKPDQPLVTAATYRPFGPLATLTLGNGLSESRGFDQRYFPQSITLAGGSDLLKWSYVTDDVGNILSITDSLNAANNRTYGYLDHQYFLTLGNGPWGTRSWSYDKIGNRLTETRGTITEIYSYPPSTGGGHSPILSQVQLGGGGTRAYQFGPAGHLARTALGANETFFRTDASGRLAQLERPITRGDATFWYDGRDFLAFADPNDLPFRDGFESTNTCAWAATASGPTATPCPGQEVRPTYSSEGLLHSLARNIAPQRSQVFHFAGRPVAQLDISAGVETWKYLTTDHLGTPIAATDTSGALLWQGGFEPFGADWSNASGAGVFLRFPGQWREGAWESAGLAPGLFYNVHRWYEGANGRYSRTDPLKSAGSQHPYAYSRGNPMTFFDALGLVENAGSCSCCSEQETALQFRQITNYIAANVSRYRISSHLFRGGCGGAADRMRADVERDLQPSCWITKSQLLRKASGINIVGHRLFGVTPSVHRVLKIMPCSPSGFFFQGIGINPYYGIGSAGPIEIGPLPERNQIEDIFDPPYWCAP